MKLGNRHREEIEINVTSLIDVVFLLLLFFMLSTTFNRETELNIQLPEANANPVEQPQRKLELVISAEGRYFIGRQELVNRDRLTLQRALAKLAGERKDVPLVISADANTPHQAVVTAMDAAGQAGLTHIVIATKQSASSESE